MPNSEPTLRNVLAWASTEPCAPLRNSFSCSFYSDPFSPTQPMASPKGAQVLIPILCLFPPSEDIVLNLVEYEEEHAQYHCNSTEQLTTSAGIPHKCAHKSSPWLSVMGTISCALLPMGIWDSGRSALQASPHHQSHTDMKNICAVSSQKSTQAWKHKSFSVTAIWKQVPAYIADAVSKYEDLKFVWFF